MSPEPMAKKRHSAETENVRHHQGGRKRLFSPAEASGFGVLGTGVQLLDTTTNEHPRRWHHRADGPPLRISEAARSAVSGRQLPVGALPSESSPQGRGPLLDNVHARLPPAHAHAFSRHRRAT